MLNKFKEKTHASLIQSGMGFSLNLFIAILPRRTCICLGSWRQHQHATALALLTHGTGQSIGRQHQHATALALLTHGTGQSIVENALLKRKEKLSPV